MFDTKQKKHQGIIFGASHSHLHCMIKFLKGKKRDLNTGDLRLKGILYRSSCFFSFLNTNTRPLFCYFILSVKEIRCFLLVKYFVQCKNKMHSTPTPPPPPKVFQQQQNRKPLSFRCYQIKIWWILNDTLRSWASTEPHLFCPFPCTYLHQHRPGGVVVTASTRTWSFGLWQLETACSHKA